MNNSAWPPAQNAATGKRKQFYKANVIGKLIDQAFAGVGYFSSRKMAREPHTIPATSRQQKLAGKLFLTLFDSLFYLLQIKSGHRLNKSLQNLNFDLTGSGVGLSNRF